ncbi:class I SAM-dependent methyltransferase [Phaeobacter sp. PT47_59]|uniref:class I SAM-dependent methyltransferase n=1 Tax=Phaeobacter sp. PT47_59 TaxID=3029979 RepID=UPI0023800DB0|nr:class I SAM-dependent methyltransferase [Phaeobacter sp. PT47_59]MDE4173190.1 class I SAM-dependent methyltransferase [Phaeobacter sp. PT47_59]
MLERRSDTHAKLMDDTYRHQRVIYDLTRKYYLFGRDRLIAELAPADGSHVLEIACGTGRNLQVAARRYPDCSFYGLDISSQMLLSARAKLGQEVRLAEADACTFDGAALFQRQGFDRIFISYGVSMIPDWEAALRRAVAHLAPGGELHVVDFSDQNGWPSWFGVMLGHWLARFHVHPRMYLQRALQKLAAEISGSTEFHQLYRGYAQYGVLRRPD